jgi:hypothetical protein
MMLTPSRGNKCIIYNKKQGVYFTLIEEKNKKVSNMSDFICFGALDMSHTLQRSNARFQIMPKQIASILCQIAFVPLSDSSE